MRFRTGLIASAIAGAAILGGTAFADNYGHGDRAKYEITITNISHGEIFTPIMAASVKPGVKIYTAGSPAGSELENVAEGGNTAPLTELLVSSGAALDVAQHDNVLFPGASVTLTVATNRKYSHLVTASMLVPTNDAFFAVNGVQGPRKKGHSRTLYLPALDAGTEINDEACASIPGPPFICQGEGVSAAGGEGFVHIHGGIHGIGDLNKADVDWRNPVARVVIKRID